MPTGQPIGGVAGVTFQNQQPVSGGTGQSIGPTLNGGGQLGGAYGAVAHGVQVFSHNLNPARQQGQSAYTGGMMVNDGRMHSLDAQISPRSSNGSVVQMGMVHLGSVAVVAGVPLSSHYQQQQQQQHPYTQYHNSGSPSAGAMGGGIGAGAMGGLAGSMQAPGHPGGIGGNGCIVGGMEGHGGVGGGSIGTNYIAGQFSSQLQQQGQSSSMDALPAARSSGSSCNDATRQADYSVSNPSDLAMRHRDLFSRAPSKVYLACPEAVPRVQGILRMNSKMGILDNTNGMSLFANERLDFTQTTSSAMPPPCMGQTNFDGLPPLQTGWNYTGMQQQMGPVSSLPQAQVHSIPARSIEPDVAERPVKRGKIGSNSDK